MVSFYQLLNFKLSPKYSRCKPQGEQELEQKTGHICQDFRIYDEY